MMTMSAVFCFWVSPCRFCRVHETRFLLLHHDHISVHYRTTKLVIGHITSDSIRFTEKLIMCARTNELTWLDFFPIVFYKLRRQKLALPTSSSTFFICYTFFQKSLFDFFRFLLFMFHFQPSRFIIIRWADSLQFCVLIAAAATTAAGEILLKLKQKLYQVNWLL